MTDDWDQHWRDYDSANAGNPANVWRRRLIFSILARESGDRPMRFADIGCGQGDLLVAARAALPGAELLGVDASAAGLDISRGKLPGARFVQQDLSGSAAIPAEIAGWATHAVCSEVVEHLDDAVTFLRNAGLLLAAGGKLILTVPGGPRSAFDRHIGHRRHYTTKDLSEVVSAAGLRPVWSRGAGFPFFNLYRLLVVARGRRLVSDVSGERPLPLSARAAMTAFGWLFRYNLPGSMLGWQIVALAERRHSRPT